MRSLAFLEQADHNRKAAMYAAAHDGKLRNFAYHGELGECRETFTRLLHAVQEGEIGVILTPDAACLAIETSPGWMEAFIQAVQQHQVLIGDHSHELVYDLREEEDEAQFRALSQPGEYERARSAPRPLADAIAQSPFAAAYVERGENWFLLTRFEGEDPDAPIYSLSSGAQGQDADMFGLGRWQEQTETGRKDGMREPPYFTHGEYQLTRVALERSDVPAETLALLSTWIEGEGLLVDNRQDVGGINFCRMDARVFAPLPHIVASFFAHRPYQRKAGHYPNWNGFYMLLDRDVEKGWQLVRIQRDFHDAQLAPVLADRSKSVEKIKKRLGNDL